jgi:hypothetical protein
MAKKLAVTSEGFEDVVQEENIWGYQLKNSTLKAL